MKLEDCMEPVKTAGEFLNQIEKNYDNSGISAAK